MDAGGLTFKKAKREEGHAEQKTLFSNQPAHTRVASVRLALSEETNMGKVSKYHTDSEEYPEATREVHHDHDDCKDGKRILPEHKMSGDGGKRRCKECMRLG
jgi:hypothetical protein